MNSYSQYGEDKIICELLGDTPGKLLDLGAWDPITFSNSRALIENGWQAVLVEPSPGPLQKLVREYGNNPRVAVVGALIAHDESTALTGLALTDDAVSTATEGVYRVWQSAGGYYGRAWVKPITLDEIFAQFGDDFDFVDVDTEGTSVQVAAEYLRHFALGGHKPRVMCVEHDGHEAEFAQFAAAFGYSVKHQNGTNIIVAL